MTSKLKEAFEEASRLPPDEQDALAAAILIEVTVEGLWDASFAKSSRALEELADEALREHRAGRTSPLEPDDL
ncbi:MAG: hypothetical protein ACREMK_02275 [Gemmatimonadota bacterium]